MSSDEYHGKDIYRYSRRSCRKSHKETQETEKDSPRLHTNIVISEMSPRNEDRNEGTCRISAPGCSCDLDPNGDIANILHKKCPVINLAQQQLQRLLDETDKLLCDNTRCCRSVYDFLCICRDIFMKQNKCRCAFVALVTVVFIAGVLVGAGTCGSYLGKFNSPILTCIDNFFIPASYSTVRDTYLSIT
ncbi:unnamed protein product [Diatraea saccharalis]|uniref:Uncharacterized protein n=1 Tax=Diatraea saccharalis TaxID=40085 RepID=A0A9N9R9F2_9NEOP|nr:unnamed protein product [Diatraea saccharalis]